MPSEVLKLFLDTFDPKVFIIALHGFFETLRILLTFTRPFELLLDVIGGDCLQGFAEGSRSRCGLDVEGAPKLNSLQVKSFQGLRT